MPKSPRNLFESYGYTPIQTPLLQPYALLQRNIHSTYHSEMVKLITPKGEVQVLRYDNTLAAINIMNERRLDRIFTMEPVYRINGQSLKIEERYAMSAEFMATPSSERDMNLLNLAFDVIRSMHQDSFIFEISHTDWLKVLLSVEPALFAVKPQLELALTKKNPKDLKKLLLPFQSHLKHYEDLIYALTAHGPYSSLIKKLESNAYIHVLSPLLKGLENTLKDLPPWALSKLHLDLAYPPKLSHYTGLYFQALSTKTNTCLASGGAYLYNECPSEGIGFIIYLEENPYE